jgi:tetratricopeptide (TPR) repeat protein
MHHWNISRIGYLAPETYGYALALLSWLREDEQPAWMRYLSVTISDPLKRGLAFLRKTDDDSVVEGESLDSISLCELFPGAARDSQTMDEDDRILEAEAREAEELETEEDRHYSDGFIYAESGQWAEAADAYSKVLERNPRDGETYQERAWAYLELGRVADAVADAEKAVKLLPDEMNAYLVRGTAYTQSKNFERGIADLNRYLEDVNNFIGEGTISSKAYYFRGLAYAGLNDFQRAVKDFSKAIIRYPQWAEPYEARAFAYEQLGKPGKAQKDREEAAYRAAK